MYNTRPRQRTSMKPHSFPARLRVGMVNFLSIVWMSVLSRPVVAFSSLAPLGHHPTTLRPVPRSFRLFESSSSTPDSSAALQDMETNSPMPNDSCSAAEMNQTASVTLVNGTENVPDNKATTSFDASLSWKQLQQTMGASVDESRILYPDIDSGEVDRLFSSLQYQDKTGSLQATRATGSVVGAAALVAGTTVGAGVLALPAATVSTGFVPSTAALLVAYVFMTTSGLLIAELTLNQIGRTGRPGLGLLELYESSLGAGWATVGTAAYFFLHYAMMVAYIAQGGTNVQSLLGADVGVPPQAVFAAAVGGSLLLAKPAWIEQVNNAMVLAVGLSFLGIVGAGATSADWSALVDPAAQHPDAVVSCFPILFLALVYQNIVPTLVNNLEGDRSKITKAIVGGTTAPLVMFLLWNAVCLGNAAGHDAVDPVAVLQSGAAGDLLAPLVTTFSVLALITSLIGFTYGLVDAWTDIFGINQKSEAFARYRPGLYALVYLPPLALSLTDPNIFYTALEYGGAFGVSTLFLVLPPLMVFKERYQDTDSPLITKPMVGWGKVPLGALLLAAAALIVQQAAEKSGLLDMLQASS